MDFIRKLHEQLKSIWSQLNRMQLILLLVICSVVFISFLYLAIASSDSGRVLLYPTALQKSDFQRVQNKLSAMDVDFIADDGYVFVSNEEIALKLRAQLGLENIVRNVKGFELFDNPSFSITDFERKVNLQRAVSGNMIRHLEALDDVDKAEVIISFGDEIPFYQREMQDNPLTASISITPAPFSNLIENKQKIRGLRDFIANGIDRLKPESVVIIDQTTGDVLTDKINPMEADTKLALASKQLKIKNSLVKKKRQEIYRLLSGIYTKDRYELVLDIDVDWNMRSVSKRKIEPIILKKDNPKTPFDESISSASVTRSSQKTIKTFKGPAFIPEGPPGSEPNVVPGAKELIDRQTDFQEISDTQNNEFSESNIIEEESPYHIRGVRIAVAIDGIWKKERDTSGDIVFGENGQVKRVYNPVAKDRIDDIRKILEGAIDKQRGDKVEVRHIQFDRNQTFEQEDESIRQSLRDQYIIKILMIVIPLMLILFIIFILLNKRFDKRRRLKEENLAQERESLRDAAILVAEEEKQGKGDLSDDPNKLSIRDSASMLVKDHPERVASLLRNWISED